MTNSVKIFDNGGVKKYCVRSKNIYVIDFDGNLYHKKLDHEFLKCERFWNNNENLIKIRSKQNLLFITDIGNIYYCDNILTIQNMRVRNDPYVIDDLSIRTIKAATK